jgi:hypothetical protein
MGKTLIRWVVISLLISFSVSLVLHANSILLTAFWVGVIWAVGILVYKNREKIKNIFSDKLEYEDFTPAPVMKKPKTLGQTQVDIRDGSLSHVEREQWEALIGHIEIPETSKVSGKEKRQYNKYDPYDPPIPLTWDTFNIFKRKNKNK